VSLDKLGLHLVGALTVRNLGRARVVKLASCSVQDFRDVRATVGSKCLLIWRKVLGTQPLDNPVARAQEFVNRWRPEMQAIKEAVGPEVAFEGYNEVGGSEAANYNAFECERLRLMHALGLRCVVGNFAVGNPPWEQWPTYGGMLNALRPGDFLGLHDYWAVPADIDDPYYCGRWRLCAELKSVPIVVTECGRDYIEDRKRRGLWPGCAWREAGISAAAYLEELRRYDEFIGQYPNVLGATIFTEGSNSSWTSRYGVAELWAQVVASYSNPQSYPGAMVPVQPPPPPPVTTPATIMRGFTPAEFAEYVAGVVVKEPFDKVCEHHTLRPTLAQWQQYGGAYWLKAMLAVYKGRGWTRFPHVFAGPDRIWVMGALELDGAGVANRNLAMRHVEIAGDYTAVLPSGATLDNAVAATATLLRKCGRGIESLWMHRDLQLRETCPGEAFAAKWPWFRALVAAQLQPPVPEKPKTIGDARWESEEATRALEMLQYERCHALLLELTETLYQLENAAKGT